MTDGAAVAEPRSRGILPPDCYGTQSLYNTVVQRIRQCETIFGAAVKLVLRQLPEDQWSVLPLPYLLVTPTFSQPQATQPPFNDIETIINPRRVTLIAQFDGRGSEAEWMAADDIEIAEKQLIGCLVNWRPLPHYRPTLYAGMRLLGARLPDVKAAFVFVFFEEIAVSDASIGLEAEQEDLLEIGDMFVRPVDYTCCVEVDASPVG